MRANRIGVALYMITRLLCRLGIHWRSSVIWDNDPLYLAVERRCDECGAEYVSFE